MDCAPAGANFFIGDDDSAVGGTAKYFSGPGEVNPGFPARYPWRHTSRADPAKSATTAANPEKMISFCIGFSGPTIFGDCRMNLITDRIVRDHVVFQPRRGIDRSQVPLVGQMERSSTIEKLPARAPVFQRQWMAFACRIFRSCRLRGRYSWHQAWQAFPKLTDREAPCSTSHPGGGSVFCLG